MSHQPASTSPSQPLISLSVVSHGDGPLIGRLLDGIARYEQPGLLQVLVTDNLDHDVPAPDPARWHSLIVLRNQRPQGFARNHNAAFQLARGEYFCVVNPDVIFVEGILTRLIASIELRAGDIAAPLVVDSSGTVQDSFRGLPSPLGLIQRRFSPDPVARPLPQTGLLHPGWIAGIFMLMRRETFARLAGFNAAYRLYFEDVDFCTRARLDGLEVIVDARIRVQHDARRASHRDPRFLLWHMQSMLRFFTSPVYRQANKARGPAVRRP